jgi:HK97 family phage major capsid protein
MTRRNGQPVELLESRAQDTTTAGAGGEAVGAPMLAEVKQALSQSNVWLQVCDVAGPDDPRRTQTPGGPLELPFITTVAPADDIAQNTQDTGTDIVYGQRVPTRRHIRTSVKGSVEFAMDNVEPAHITKNLMIKVGAGQLAAITPDILADVPDSGITPAAIDRANVLQMIGLLDPDYLKGAVWMASPATTMALRGTSDQAAGAWDNPFDDKDDPRLEGMRVLRNKAMADTGANALILFNPAWVVVDLPHFPQTQRYTETLANAYQVYWKGWGEVGGALTCTEAAIGLNIT